MNNIPFHMIKNVKTAYQVAEPVMLDTDINATLLSETVLKLLKLQPLETNSNQLCLTHKKGSADVWHEGSGSLAYVGDAGEDEKNGHKSQVGFFNAESAYTELNDEVKGTEIEHVYNEMTKHYSIGRFRVMGLLPNTCLAWHRDTSPRIHVAVKTSEACKFAIQNSLFHIPADGHAYYVDTTKDHSVFNGSNELRLHIVGTII